MTQFTADYFELQLKFNSPQIIASTSEDDFLIVEIRKEEWFTDSENKLPLDRTSKTLYKVIPKQISDE